MSRTARVTSMAGAALRRPRRSNLRCRSWRGRNARALRWCRRDWLRFRPRCWRSCMPAIMCSSPTAPMGRRAPSAIKFWPGSASPRPITIRSSAPASPTCSAPIRARFIWNCRVRRASKCRTSAPSLRSPRPKGAIAMIDNTWATPLYFRPLDHGIDLVDPGRHQIYRRPFRRDARHGVGQCGNASQR